MKGIAGRGCGFEFHQQIFLTKTNQEEKGLSIKVIEKTQIKN